MLSLVLQNYGGEGLAGIYLRLTLHQIRTLTYTVALFLEDNSTNEEDAECVFCTGRLSEDHKGEELVQCANMSDGRTHFVLVWRKVL